MLGAVSKMTEAGNIVIFDEVGGYKIINRKSGRVTPMRKENGVFKTTLWVPTNKRNNISNITKTDADPPKQIAKLNPYGANPFQGLDNELI